MNLEELLEKVENTDVEDSKLYFITRKLKDNLKRSGKATDKYTYKVYQVDIDEEIRINLYESSLDQIKSVIAKGLEITDYDVISDDNEQLFTYNVTESNLPFKEVVAEQLTAVPQKLMSLEALYSNNEQLWTYCIGFNDPENSEWIYTFRKVQSGKVAVDEKYNKRSGSKAIRTLFDTRSQKLELFRGEAINLDKQIDCIFYKDTFYIIRKNYFEQIVDIKEEFKNEAKQVITRLKETDIIRGLEKIEDKIESHPSIHKKLVKISRIDNYRDINEDVLEKMQTVCNKYGDNLNVKEGKLYIEEEKDVDVILKMLADYYKTGEVSGKTYGTFAGKRIDV